MALTLSGTNGVVGAGFTVDASGVSVTAGVGTFTSYQGSGASLTSIPAANIVGVATAGFERTGGYNSPSFSARRNSTQNLSTGVEAVIIFNSEDHDTDDAYDTSTGEFTVPAGKGGVYQINAHLGIDDVNSGFIVRLRVFKNGSQFYGMRTQNIGAATNSILSAHISATATLAAGDVIKCMGFHNDSEGAQPIEVDANGFSMFRLSI